MAKRKKKRKVLHFSGAGSILGLSQGIRSRAKEGEEFPYTRYAAHRLAVFMPIGASSDELPRAWREKRKRRRDVWQGK